MAKEIPLTRGYVAVVDDHWFDYLNQWKWSAVKAKNNSIYAARVERKNGRQKMILMHRVVNQTPEGVDTDHVNGNKLDNQEHNLRNCTQQENARNRPVRKTSSTGYKGVEKTKCGFRARICIGGKDTHLGAFKTSEDAARAYDRKASEIYGEFARLNFPE